MMTWRPSSRLLLAAGAVLLAAALVLPLWSTHMEAPQYRNEEALEVHVYPGRIEGDVAEIETLNQYVGVALPLDTPELAASPWVLGGLLLAVSIGVALPLRARVHAALVLAVAMVSVAAAGGALLQYRLYQMGHVRGDAILEGVPDFTPPLLGTAKIANFTIHMGLGAGGWAYALAVVLVLLSFLVGRRERMALSEKRDKDSGRVGFRAGAAVVLGMAALGALFAGGLVLIPRYQASHPPSYLQRSDADRVRVDDLYLDLTLVTPSFLRSRKLETYLGEKDPDSVLPVLVGLNAHTGDIGHMHHLPGRLDLIGPDGHRYPALTEPIVLSQHHNAYLLLFPARGHDGSRFVETEDGTIAVEVTDMGQTPVRRFEWVLPLPSGAEVGSSTTLAAKMMLTVALVSALLVVLSPCALELTLYYTAIISCTVTEGAEEAAAARGGPSSSEAAGKRRLYLNLGSFIAGFTLLYAASGATVGLIGEGVRRPMGEYGEILPIAGGLLILFFALKVAGAGGWLRRLGLGSAEGSAASAGLLDPVWRRLAELRRRGQRASGRTEGMRARDSFLVGMGLSSACLSCMGGAVLYPLLVYAGITSWYSGLITLTLYSLGIAVPMVLIALGFFRIRLTLQSRMGFHRLLRYASAAMLAGIGLLIVTGNERVITDVTFRFLAEVSSWSV